MWSVKLALYIVWREGGTELAGFEIQHSLHLQSPKFTTSRAVTVIFAKYNWSLVLSIFCFSLKVLSQGSSGENPQSPALIDSTKRAHLEYCHYPLDGMLFCSRVTASNGYVADSINTPVGGENQCRAKIPL